MKSTFALECPGPGLDARAPEQLPARGAARRTDNFEAAIGDGARTGAIQARDGAQPPCPQQQTGLNA